MKKKYSLIFLAFLCFVVSGYGQIATIDFETNLNGYSHTPSQTPATDPGDQYFHRAMPSDAAIYEGSVGPYTNVTGSWMFVGSAPNAINSGNPGILTLDPINIAGFTNLELSMDWGAVPNDWDDVDGISVEYRYDNTGPWSTLYNFGHNNGFNDPLVLSGNATGGNNTANGTVLTYALQTITTDNFTGTGTNINIRIVCDSGNNYEAFGLDNIVLDGTSTCTPPADPNGTITGTTPACSSTTLTYTGTDTTPLLLINYWQTSPTGTDQSNDAINTYNVTASGTYYVRKYDVVADCWSDNSVSYSVIIDTAVPSISTQPTDQTVIIPATATFSVASSDATSYQWEVSTNGGSTWANVSGGTGATTDTYTTGGTSLPMDGNLYRCITTNSCGSTSSNTALLSAANLADVVITEIMYNTTGTDDEWIEICNVSGSSQALNSYTIEVGGTTEFTFPSSGVVIADGNCITVSLGDGGGGTYNPDCPFTPDYTNGAGTGTLNNSSDTISLIASDGTTTIDAVTYDNGDGADGTGESLHVIDTSVDNSVTSANYWEVINGGSPGINSLISPCTPVGPEINVEGATTNFPDISDGDTTPITFDGTDFGDSNVGSPLTNTFRIENFGGTVNLTINSVTVSSGDTGDFSITALPASPITPANPNGFSLFDIEFLPTVPGMRTAIIEIRSNDSDEDPYTFTVTGNGLCVASGITALPTSGPEGTIVTVTGTDLATATASFNGLAATVNNISATEMEVTVPSGATTGNLEIVDSLGCPGSTPFTVIDSQISGCEGSGGTTPTDLFISEVTDATRGGLTYVELFNGTGAAINIDNYSIEVISDGDASPAGFNIFDLENVSIPNGSTYVIALGLQTPVTSTNACISETGGSGELASSANAQFSSGGINKKTNEHDVVRLVNSGTTIDEFGVYLDSDWMDSTSITGDRGFNFRRSNTATSLPDPTFTLAELGNWTIIDWPGSGVSSCGTNDYSDIGLFDFSIGSSPNVNVLASPTFNCTSAIQLSVTATEGASGGLPLAYQWYYLVPNTSSFVPVPDNADFNNVTTATLDIVNPLGYGDYQFYCQVRENTTTCYQASNAVKLNIITATWNGSWSSAPALNKIVVIDDDYDTSVGTNGETSFEACECIVNTDNELTIANNTYVLVENDLTVNGNIIVETDGSFVQVNDAAVVDGAVLSTRDKISVEKETAMLASHYEYTYWSSPVVGESISDGLAEANPVWLFSFNAQNFRDSTQETNNNDATAPGQDDVDDNGDDWQHAPGATIMSPGIGYAATHDLALFINPAQYKYIFEGPFNNGVYNIPIYRNDAELNDNNWNFIGNPYPSAVDADLFLATNASIDQTVGATNGALFFWSHNTVADANTNGNENLNYSQSDYAIINGSGQTAGGDGIIPNRFIPSGQGFFISMDDSAASTSAGGSLRTTDIIFNNSMRVTGGNNQFFRNSIVDQPNKLWLDLTSDNGVFNQILVAYVDGATDNYDGAYYDAHKNLSSELYSGIYSLISDSTDKKFAIQGKDPISLTTDEVIPVGFSTVIDEPTIYKISIRQFEGVFMHENDIYVIDHLLNSIHNLKDSDYSFTSEKGEFNERFEIVFRADALSIDDNQLDDNDLSIVEQSNGDVRFSIGKSQTITNVEILDVLGRQVYNLKGSSSVEVYDLSRLSNAAYIAKVTLSNGQVISKKAIKRK